MKTQTCIGTMIMTLALLAPGALSVAAEDLAAYTRIDKPYECMDSSWVPRTLAKAPELKSERGEDV